MRKEYNRLDVVLRQKKISTDELCNMTGFTRQTINNWRKNKAQPAIKTLFKIAIALGIEARDLLNEDK